MWPLIAEINGETWVLTTSGDYHNLADQWSG